MSNSLDWKFVVTFVVTLAGVVVPIAVWQADLSAKAITVDVVSSTSLEPSTSQQVQGFAVTIEGTAVPKPFVSVLQLRNSGSRPVTAAEFEAPIEISVTTPTRIVRAGVASTDPPDLNPTLALASGNMVVHPLLLNPRDSIKLNVLTADSQPTFSARSRIAGITSIPVTESSTAKMVRSALLQEVIGVVLLSVYLVQMTQALDAFRRRSAIQLWTFLTSIASAFGGTILLVTTGSAADGMVGFRTFLIHASPSVPLAFVIVALRARLQSAI